MRGGASEFTLSAGGDLGLNGTFVLLPDGGFQNAAIQEGSAQRSGCVGSWDPATATLTLDCGGVGTAQSCAAT